MINDKFDEMDDDTGKEDLDTMREMDEELEDIENENYNKNKRFDDI